MEEAINKDKEIELKAIEVLRTIYDPEIPVDIYELGLIYEILVTDKKINVKMTLTSPNCPVAESLPVEVESKLKNIAEVEDAKVDIVFEPPWDKEMMSEAAKLELGFF
jgi:FeS assembly SUF system protein